MDPKPRKPWWRMKRWRVALLAWLLLVPVLYVLSVGPATYAANRGWLPFDAIATTYPPLLHLSRWSPAIDDRLMRYQAWWAELAIRHKAASN